MTRAESAAWLRADIIGLAREQRTVPEIAATVDRAQTYVRRVLAVAGVSAAPSRGRPRVRLVVRTYRATRGGLRITGRAEGPAVGEIERAAGGDVGAWVMGRITPA